MALARSKEEDHRVAAVYALGALRDKAAISALIGLVQDELPPVRPAALQALERLGGVPDDGEKGG